ncbi:lysophospholipid acyltransferase family protein [Pasteurella atlantica]|uniref:lysophospholipid acyltransferase family protein n=1 Tax=Pasteurellaceae TaxID=712 RepID=UPI00275EE450|nr:lysophospholipid acyltransferase family protein [Pasteurella atlantica]MDP8098892.1 lysophospholipid acyltransferase family protein [Pasteurella atlantica]MDP8106919.1 lysophospholipid acyltransferase family protein [Pasteurella atlantica]MDP8116609.1 lysophospholipid acyltransferase family protein [Pasteurella atlantica]
MAQKLDWLRRFLGTMFGFVLFGLAGILIKVILYPYVKDHKNNSLTMQLKARKIVSNIWLFFVKYLTWAGVLEVKYTGFERLGKAGQLVIANHPSLLDVVLIFSQQHRFNCIIKKDLLHNPTMTSPILSCGFLPNTESEELLIKTNEVLKEQPLLLFPEGTRTDWDGVIKFNRGATSLGLRSAKIITPIVIKMSPLNFKKGQAWYKIPPCRIQYELTVGEDIDPQTYLAKKPLPIASRLLNKDLENYFNTQTRI